MTDFIEGESRNQATLFPERLDDYIAQDSSVRVIDVFVDELAIGRLGFKVQPEVTGRPAYHPATLLKIYLYGYLNRVQSSRRLERETQRNVEVMWLTGRLSPDFKTIADFRKDNGVAIRKVCREFVLLCRKLNLFADAFVAIDGSKFKAVNNRDRNFTAAKIKKRLKQIDESIERYLGQMASADRQDSEMTEQTTGRLKDKIDKLKQEIVRLNELEEERLKRPEHQISLTDPDARSMATSGKGSGIVGYNVQTAVDVKHHLIPAHEVTNVGHDRGQLSTMAKQACEAMDVEELTVVADAGYFKGEEIVACEEAGIEAYVPKPQTSGNKAKGLYDKKDFHYVVEEDVYRCPAGERLPWRMTSEEKGRTLHRYWSSACQGCAMKSQCTTGKERRVTRWENEAVLEAMQHRLEQEPERMRARRETVEHPFGTIKSWMGATHFQMRTLEHVSTEMSLHVLAYNMKRVMNILGTVSLMEAMRALMGEIRQYLWRLIGLHEVRC
jgi:transposase